MTHFREPAQQLFPSYVFIIPRVFQLMFESLPSAEKPFIYLLDVQIHAKTKLFKCMSVVFLILSNYERLC